MAWTAPKTFVAGSVLTAAELNTHLRDNLNLLKTSINDLGRLEFEAATELTIATGAITITQNSHRVDTESDAATDDLDTVTAGGSVGSGFVLALRQENSGRDVTFKDGSGNLLLNGDYTPGDTDGTLLLYYDGTNWRELSRSVIVGAAPATPDLSAIYNESLPKAWAHVTNAGTPTLDDDYNVTSLTDNGVGDTTVTFATALAVATYAASVNASVAEGAQPITAHARTYATGSVVVTTYLNATETDYDFEIIVVGE